MKTTYLILSLLSSICFAFAAEINLPETRELNQYEYGKFIDNNTIQNSHNRRLKNKIFSGDVMDDSKYLTALTGFQGSVSHLELWAGEYGSSWLMMSVCVDKAEWPCVTINRPEIGPLIDENDSKIIWYRSTSRDHKSVLNLSLLKDGDYAKIKSHRDMYSVKDIALMLQLDEEMKIIGYKIFEVESDENLNLLSEGFFNNLENEQGLINDLEQIRL